MNCCKSAGAPKLPPTMSYEVKEQYRAALEKALRCLRLARVTVEPATVRLLEEMAADYLHEVERLARGEEE